MVNYDGKFAPGSMLYFVMQRDTVTAAQAAERLMNALATQAYSITLAISLGQLRTLVEAPYCITHASLPEAEKRARGLEPGGIRMSIGLED